MRSFELGGLLAYYAGWRVGEVGYELWSLTDLRATTRFLLPLMIASCSHLFGYVAAYLDNG